MSNTTLTAPAGVSPGSKVLLPDGTSTTVDSSSQIACPPNFVSQFLGAGWTYGSATTSQTSQAASKGDSGGVVASTANSVATSEASADSSNVSTAASKGDSGGTAASTASSKAVSDSVILSTLTSRVTSAGA